MISRYGWAGAAYIKLIQIIKGIMKKIVGLIAFFMAVGMLIMLIAHNRLVGLIIIALLLFVGYNCFCSD